MKHLLFVLLLSVIFVGCSSTSNLHKHPSNTAKITDLPKTIDETSGLAFYNGYFWTHNDSGGKAEIYAIDPKTGNIVKTVKIRNAENIDWEDLAQDDKYFYIADTGNNRGKRREFQIYKVPILDIFTSWQDKVINVDCETITFSFEHQPTNLKLHRHNYDMEALCVVNGQLYIFSKNWANNKTYLYHITNDKAVKIKTYNPQGLVTGGVYDATNNRMYLIGYHRYVWVNNLSPFVLTIDNFGSNNERVKKILLKGLKGYQVEAIMTVENSVFFTNEGNDKGQQTLWKLVID